jgi:hypothetical protein
LRYLVQFAVALVLFLLVVAPRPTPATAASSGFTFNWNSDPSSPQRWVPGIANDWDVIANIDYPTDATGSMAAGHGSDCGPPPGTHPIQSLADSVFLCKNHMMTAINAGGDAANAYGAVYFTPAQLLDWSQGTAKLSWQVSTQRLSRRDWWQVNLTPFAQNLVLPVPNFLPSYQGEPASGLEFRIDGGTCQRGNIGTIFRVSTISSTALNDVNQSYPCVDDAVAPSFRVRTPFEIDVSANHLKVFLPGTAMVFYDGPISLPFRQAVVQFSHHSYDPEKSENFDNTSPGLPNTYHWSGVSIEPATPFTLLRPQQPLSLHPNQNPTLTLPQPAPANAFLRFAGLGPVQVSFDGGRTFQTPHVQNAARDGDEGIFVSYWSPVPAGITQLVFRGEQNKYGQPWWIEDVSVWSNGAPAPGAPPGVAPVQPPGSTGASNVAPSGVLTDHGILKPQGATAAVAPQAAARAPQPPILGGIERALGTPVSLWWGLLAGVLLTALVGGAVVGGLWLQRRRAQSPRAG